MKDWLRKFARRRTGEKQAYRAILKLLMEQLKDVPKNAYITISYTQE